LAVGSNLAAMASLLGRYNVPLSVGTPIDFPSGSMFWCRSQALTPWLRFGFSWDSFEESRHEARDASLAHALERSFLFGCELEGLTWARAGQLHGTSCGVPAAG
jgi:lipopolysaccharide biosynthesis protein